MTLQNDKQNPGSPSLPVEILTHQNWEADMRPTQAICELFDFLEDVQFWIKDSGGFYHWVNLGNLINLGLEKREDVIGKTDFDLSPEYIAAQFRTDDELVLTGEKILNRIELVGRFAHFARWCVTFKVPLRNENGKILGTAGIARPLKTDGEDWSGLPLGKVVAFIARNMSNAIENGTLAKMAGLSERALERQFRRHYGTTPQQYIRILRVRSACRALIYTPQSICQIASDHGFSDQSHFTRAFQKIIPETPAAYRKRFQEHCL